MFSPGCAAAEWNRRECAAVIQSFGQGLIMEHEGKKAQDCATDAVDAVIRARRAKVRPVSKNHAAVDGASVQYRRMALHDRLLWAGKYVFSGWPGIGRGRG
jgi:hypothetical protein